MNSFIQYKYITMLSSKLEGFKKNGNNIFNFRCPICGDSEKNKNKKRGYILYKNGEYIFYCHNCGASKSFISFLYEIDTELYMQYKKELIHLKYNKNDANDDIISLCTKQSKKIHKLYDDEKHHLLIPVNKLHNDHAAVLYLNKRCVPTYRYKYVYWTEKFKELIAHSFGDSYSETELPESGIVFDIRSFTDDHPVIGYQIRTIDPNTPKNLRFKICKEDDIKGAYGVDRINHNEQIYVVEGTIDSLFLPNCIAVLTASLWRIGVSDGIKNAIYINDCEPRNKQVVSHIKKTLDAGYRTVMLPDEYDSLDINDIICKYNFNERTLVELIQKHAYSGLTAKVTFSKWSKV